MNRLKEYREKSKMTQQELADKSGVSRATIVDIEGNSKKDVKVSTLVALAKSLGSDVRTIFFDTIVKHD